MLQVPEAKISLSSTDRVPTLPEKMEIVDSWFKSNVKTVKSYRQADVHINLIAELLVAKQLASDKDTGIKVIVKTLNLRETDKDMYLNYALFQQLFIRCLFKESLIQVLKEIEQGVVRKKKYGGSVGAR